MRTRLNLAIFVRATCASVALVWAVGIPDPAAAQGRSKPILKCVIDGEIVYTDLPCRDAHRIAYQLSPHTGARYSDRSREQADARRSGEVLSYSGSGSPMGARLVAYGGARNPECPHLEQRMLLVEAEERSVASTKAMQIVQERLAVQRNRHRELGC